MTDRERLVEQNHGDELIFLDPPEWYDDCVIGLAHRATMPTVVDYNYDKVILVLTSHVGSWQDAIDWFGTNVIGSWMGDLTPMFVETKEWTNL